jgi:signal transduction histidine kinase
MKPSALKRFLSWIGPHDYNYSVIFAWIFIFMWAQARPFVLASDNTIQRVKFGLEASLIISSISLLIVFYLFACMKLRNNKAASLPRYFMEIIGATAVFTFLTLFFSQTIIAWTNRPRYLGPDDRPVIFIVRIACCFLFVAATHQLQKSLKLRLQDAERMNESLVEEYKALIAADEEIRGEVSRYLHDRVQSELMLASFQLKKRVDELGFSSDEEIGKAIHQLEKIRSSDIKFLSQLLTPNIEVEGVRGAIESLCSQYSSSIDFHFELDLILDQLTHEKSLGVFRIIEQAIINAITHGPASKINIVARANSAGGFTVEISDNGPGVHTLGTGTGSVIIDAWVSILNGRKEILSKAGSGYTLIVSFPAAT